MKDGRFKREKFTGEYLPIFEPLRMFIKQDTGIDLPVGKCWLRRISNSYTIVAFKRRKGEQNKYKLLEVKLYNVKLQDDNTFHLTVHKYTNQNRATFCTGYDYELLTFSEMVTVKTIQLMSLEQNAIRFVRSALYKNEKLVPVLLHSTGKNATVLAHIIEKAYDNILTIYASTTVNDGLNIKYAKENDIEIVYPKNDFYTFTDNNGWIPTYHGFKTTLCCQELGYATTVKNYLVGENFRKNYLLFLADLPPLKKMDIPEQWKISNPLRSWTELDIWLYIFRYKLPYNMCYDFGFTHSAECMFCCRKPYINALIIKKLYKTPVIKDIIGYDYWRDLLSEDFIAHRMWSMYDCTVKEYLDTVYSRRQLCRCKTPRQDVIDEFKYYYPNCDMSLYFNDIYCEECGIRIYEDDIMLAERTEGKLLCSKCYRKKYNLKTYERTAILKRIRKQSILRLKRELKNLY